MKSLNNLFLFSFLISLLTAEVHAGPKRIFDSKNDRPPLTVEEQTNLNRAAAERAESGEDESEDEAENPSKKVRGETMPHISEAPSQAALEGQETASSSASIIPTASVRFLRTQVIPTLKRFALEKLMTLPAEHFVFRDGLPPQLECELIEPYFNKITEMIQDAHKACQRYSLYLRPSDVKEKNSLIKVKKALQQYREVCQNNLIKETERNFPDALFRMDSMTQVFPELTSIVEHLKEQEDYKQQAKLARNSGQIARASSLENVAVLLNQQASVLFSIAREKIKLQQQLLKDSPDAEIESSQETIAALKNQVTRTAPLIERQKTFLGRAEEFDLTQQSGLQTSFQASHKILKDLDAASAADDEETMQLLRQQLNAHDQTIKTLLSTDSRVRRIQEKIVYGNGQVALTASMIVNIKLEQRRMTAARENRITTMKSGEEKVRRECYAPIFDLYQIPSFFLDKEVALLQESEVDSLAGKETLALQKRILAKHWHALAAETARSVNILSQIEMVVDPEEFFLGQNGIAVRAALRDQEDQLATQAATLPVDRTMASLPWDFKKTFEENVAALHQEEEL